MDLNLCVEFYVMWNRNSLFLVLLILFSCLHAAFEKEVLDSNKLSRYPSLGVGPDGMPQVIYGGGSFGLTYKYWDGTSWVSEPIGDQERATMVTSLAVDSKNFPHICYSPFGFYAEYLFWDGGSWGTQVVDPEGKKVSLCSIALDSNDVPHIAYVFGIHDTLKYAALSGGTWKIQEVV